MSRAEPPPPQPDVEPDGDDRRPMLRVVRGEPTPEELAALVAVITTYVAEGVAEVLPEISPWGDPATTQRRSLRVGPGLWASSGREYGVRTRADW